ncbi:hypothetical protein [uncultured Tateyamaria sp.]|uniref:hypothetical protein n=1 Tax=uncultured Tateyamaria sp. TaxID=455651 RepID=UPI00263A24EF|nr:hypothetical protein [uncultured Tateyamaria sp.]
MIAVLLLATTSLSAQEYHDAKVVDLVRSEDRAGLNAFLNDAHDAFQKGEISADDMRDLFIALSRSHDQTVRFVQDWAEAAPDNANAQIARAWSLWHAADQVHEPGSAAARAVFDGMRARAVEHAMLARELNADLIPVSDAVLRMFVTDRSIGDPAAALDKVMETHPNWGSLLRVYPLVGPYGKDAIGSFCGHYGPLVTPDATAKCRMYGFTYYTRGILTDFAGWDGWDAVDPDMIMLRISGLTTKFPQAELSQEEVAWLEQSILHFDADLYELMNLRSMALNFANRVAMHRGQFRFYEQFKAAHLHRAEEFLETDPYNLDLLDMVEGVAFEPEWEVTDEGDGRVSYTAIDPGRNEAQKAAFRAAKEAQMVDFAGRRLMANPHRGDNWLSYAYTARDALGRKYYFDVDGAFENAAVYGSTDPVDSLDAILLHKTHQFELLGFRDAPRAAHIWEAIGRDIDVPNEVLCPFLRAHLLRQALCANRGSQLESCTQDTVYDQASYDALLADAQSAPQCVLISEADVESLWYTPVPMSEALVPVPAPAR